MSRFGHNWRSSAASAKLCLRASLRRLLLGFSLFLVCVVAAFPSQDGAALEIVDQARRAYEASQYQRAVELLRGALEKPGAALWMMRSYYELHQWDAAIASGERAVELSPSNSDSHLWLGRSYGRKAEKSGWFSAMSLAKKARREFETAVHLDPTNFDAQQDLIEYYCSAPSIVGGGEDKARQRITELTVLDSAEGRFAHAQCLANKKNWSRADAEFTAALRADQKRPFIVYEIADYFMKRYQADFVLESADAGAKLDPADQRANFYRAVGRILKNERLDEAEIQLQAYLQRAPKRLAFPSFSTAHEWLGRLYQQQGRYDAATKEYRAALESDPQNKSAREALKHVPK